MTLASGLYAAGLLIQYLQSAGTLYPSGMYQSVYKGCVYGAATYTSWYNGWSVINHSFALIGTDTNGISYYSGIGTTLSAGAAEVTASCVNGPSDDYFPAITGYNGRVQIVATLAKDGTPEVCPMNSAPWASYTGYPVVAALSIGGLDYAFAAGVASALTVASAQSACGLVGKTIDIKITLKCLE